MNWLDHITEEITDGSWRGSILLGLVLALTLRVGLGILMAAVWLSVSKYLDPSLLDSYGGQIGLDLPGSRLGQALLGVWVRWDAIHYLRLAEFGYQGAGVGSSAFYPLYPALAGGLAKITGLTTLASALLLSTLCSWFTFSTLHQLTSKQLNPEIALWTTLTLAVFPTSFFLIGPFTESLFLALTLGALLAAYQRSWWVAGLLAALGTLTRGPGLLTAVPLAWIGWQAWADRDRNLPLRALLPVGTAGMLALLPGFLFQYWRQLQGFPTLTATLRIYSRQQWVGPLRGISLAVEQLTKGWEFLPLLEFTAATLFIALTIYLLKKPELRRLEWVLYQAANLTLFISFNSFEASAWRSMARYVLVLFPSFIAIGQWLKRRDQRTRFWFLTLSTSLLLIFSSLYSIFWFLG